jgi:hypothetical protein
VCVCHLSAWLLVLAATQVLILVYIMQVMQGNFRHVFHFLLCDDRYQHCMVHTHRANGLSRTQHPPIRPPRVTAAATTSQPATTCC